MIILIPSPPPPNPVNCMKALLREDDYADNDDTSDCDDEVVESEKTAKWQYTRHCEELGTEIKKLREEVRSQLFSFEVILFQVFTCSKFKMVEEQIIQIFSKAILMLSVSAKLHLHFCEVKHQCWL